MEDIKIKCIESQCGHKEFLFPVHEQEFFKKNGFALPKRCRDCRARIRREKAAREPKPATPPNGEKNWEVACMVDGEKPTVGQTGLCGPCCFGEAATAGGNW